MYQTERHRRLRLLVKKLNRERKRQAKKIDILCNDLIAAQRDFIRRLNTISFTANFYKSIVGASDLARLLNTAGRYVKEEIADVNTDNLKAQEVIAKTMATGTEKSSGEMQKAKTGNSDIQNMLRLH